MSNDKMSKIGVLALLLVTVVWGLSFPFLKIQLTELMPFQVISLRFFISTVVLTLIFIKRLSGITKELVKNSFKLSITMFSSYICGTVGMKYTDSSKASFYSCLSVLILPFLLTVFYKERLSKKTYLCVFVATLGVFAMSYSGNMGLLLNIGDIICLGCSFFSAFQMIIVSKVAKNSDPILINILTFAFTTLFSTIVSLFTEPFPKAISGTVWFVTIFLALFGTDFAFCAQVFFQKYIEPSRVGIIFALEPVLGAIFSVILLKESVGTNSIIGGILIMLSVFIMEVNFKSSKQQDMSIKRQ